MKEINGIVIDENIKNCIKEKGFTVTQIAEIIGINRNTLYATFLRLRENGKIDFDLVLEICKILNVTPTELLFNDPPPATDPVKYEKQFNVISSEYYIIKDRNTNLFKIINKKTQKKTEITEDQLIFLLNQITLLSDKYTKTFIKHLIV